MRSRSTPLLLAAMLIAAGLTSSAAQQRPDRSQPPATGPAPALSLPPIQQRVLSNGLRVWIVEAHEVPLVNISVTVKAGAAADPVGMFGVASFTAEMLDEGAGSRDALALADAVAFLGASLSTTSGVDSSTIRLNTPVAKLDAALALLADVTLRPSFAAAEVERIREERLTGLLQTRDNASALATAAFLRVLYGQRHRYGTGLTGNETSLGEMSARDLVAFYRAYYQPGNAHILVVGDVTPDDVTERLERALGGWRDSGPVRPPALPAAAQHDARHVYLVDKPGAAQSQIRIGWIGVARDTDDFFVLEVMNTILGGSFASRLNQNLREEHGYAYGASSSFSMRQHPGPFVASAGVQSDKTVESLTEFFKELDAMHEPMPAGELSRGRNLLALGFPGSFETAAGIAGNLSDLVVYGLPESFFSTYVPAIQAVSGADVQRAARQYLRTDKFAVVVVGDLATIEQPIRDANLGPVTVLAIDDIVK